MRSRSCRSSPRRSGPARAEAGCCEGRATSAGAARTPDSGGGGRGGRAALVLVDPALPQWPDAVDPIVGQMFLAYITPGVGEMFLQSIAQLFTPEDLVSQFLALCTVDASRIPADVVRAHVELRRELGGT